MGGIGDRDPGGEDAKGKGEKREQKTERIREMRKGRGSSRQAPSRAIQRATAGAMTGIPICKTIVLFASVSRLFFAHPHHPYSSPIALSVNQFPETIFPVRRLVERGILLI